MVAIATDGFAAEYLVESLIPDSPIHGVNGMEFDSDGYLIVSSMAGAEIYRIDVQSGETTTLVGAPEGLGDGLAIGLDGTIAWTALPAGEIRALRPNGQIVVLASGLDGINSIKFGHDGRLYAAQVRADDAVYEIDLDGDKAVRRITRGMDCPAEELCGLNSFDISDGNVLYGPLMASGAVVRIDLDDGHFSELASGFDRPTGVRLDSKGSLYALNWLVGSVVRLDLETLEKEIVSELPPPLDNLTVGPDGMVYVSNPVHNVIFEINPETRVTRRVVQGGLVMPGGLTVTQKDGRETLLVSGVFGHSWVDAGTGDVTVSFDGGRTKASFAIDSNANTIATSDYRNGTVRMLDGDSGKELRVFAGLESPYDVKLLDDDSLLVAEYGSGSLLQLGPGPTRHVVAEGLGGPLGLAVAGDGFVYITETAAGVVSRIDLANRERTLVARDLNQPEGIVVDPDEKLIVAEVGAKRLILVDPATGASETIAADLPIGLAPYVAIDGAGPQPFLPTGVAVGQGGEIFVVSDVNHTVLKITPAPRAFVMNYDLVIGHGEQLSRVKLQGIDFSSERRIDGGHLGTLDYAFSISSLTIDGGTLQVELYHFANREKKSNPIATIVTKVDFLFGTPVKLNAASDDLKMDLALSIAPQR